MTVPGTLVAALADRYRVERELGAGGMATVYLAEDLKHGRKVAIKVLRPELAAVIGAERFVREIRTIAALQHPHILGLIDSGELDGTAYYVMPYVEGESLRDRLTREKQLPVADAVRLAGEVASALDYAHRHGVIHRDIKPENVLLHDGRALVADFGIALAVSRSENASRMTETGMSLGTPQYMSPEQAMGEREIGPPSDVYALGAMTYEMLTGDAPFIGSSAQAIVAKILTEQPAPIRRVRPRVPAAVDAAVLTALEKLPADRFATAAAFADALSGATSAPARAGESLSPVMTQSRRLVSIAAWAGWAVALVAGGLWAWGRVRAEPPPVSKFVMGFAPGQSPGLSMLGTHIAVSRDGATLVYTAGDSIDGQLWVKARGELTARPVPGTEGAYDPFISPDGRQVGYISDRDGRSLKVVPLSGGLPNTVVGAPLGTSGADWGSDGYIYFDADNAGLQRVRPDGSGRETVLPLDSLRRENGIAWPEVLPGNRVILFRLRHANDAPRDFSIVACRIGTRECGVLTRAVSARYAAGRLLFVTVDGTLQTARFDERHLALASPPQAAASSVRIAGTYAGVDLAVSDAGTLYYVAGSAGAASELEWVARDGTARPADSTWRESGEIRGVALSPDGKRAAIELSRSSSTGSDIWIKQLPAGALTRLTLDPAPDLRPAWSGDGKSILFISERVHPQAVFRRQADGVGTDVLIAQGSRDISEVGQSPDGRWLVARSSGAQSGAGDILAMQLGVDSTLRPLISGPAAESNPTISPDGHWLAYVSTASGRREVYVRPFPDVDRGVLQVSTDGGVEPRWAHSGRELFFRGIATLDLMAVDIETTPVLRAGQPRVLFHSDAASGLDYARYAVAPDDRHFLMVGQSNRAQPQLVRIENFLSSLGSGSSR
jgi:serine/threonine-protein kinase